jgi:hypothetical protein
MFYGYGHASKLYWKSATIRTPSRPDHNLMDSQRFDLTSHQPGLVELRYLLLLLQLTPPDESV